MNILDKIRENRQFINASCNGQKCCGLCKIKLLNAPISFEEETLLTKEELDNGVRLACCQAYQNDDYEIINNKFSILDDLKTTEISLNEGIILLIDVGTTTVVLKWIDTTSGSVIKSESFVNPQCVYGGDVISRISFNNYHLLNKVLLNEIKKRITSDIQKIVVCGNTTMTNLLLDQDISFLGHLPFEIPIKDKQEIELFGIKTFVFPSLSAFVGGDIVSGILACDIDASDENSMLIDLGTNGEIALGNKDGIITSSSAAGPAFEAVGITCGGPSVTGAIYQVDIINEKINYKTIDDVTPTSICGSGLISLIANLKRNNLINKTGKFINKIDKYYLTENIYVTQKDIQTFLLAKAAIQTGVTVLIRKKSVSKIFVAGGFGNSIKIEDLVELKMIPNNISTEIIGNSAISGLYKYAMQKLDQRIDKIVKISQNINLAKLDDFEDIYVDSLYI